MKNKLMLGVSVFFFALSSCSTSGAHAQQPTADKLPDIKYVAVKTLNAASTITLSDINDFWALITDHKITHVFYTDTMFFVQSGVFAVPVMIASNGYKNLAEYRAGNGIGFKDGSSYYYAQDNKLKNQGEVDYYKQEKFFSIEDYRNAQKDGFEKPNVYNRNNRLQKITGIVKKSDLEKNIYFANVILYLMFFQQTDLAKSFLNNTDVVSLTLPFTKNANRNYYNNSGNVFVEFKTGYYYINIDISGLDLSKDAVFYYASKFAQYANYADYQGQYSANNQYTIRNSETVAKNDLKYLSYQACVNDINNMMLNSGQ